MVKGVSTYYGEDGTPTAQWVKSAIDPKQAEQAIDEIVEALHIPKFKPVKPPKPSHSDTMNVYVFGDPHIDMLSYINETGANWDLEIAIQHHTSAMLDLIERAPKADTGVLATLGDLYHRDSLKAITPGSGNIVDVDGRISHSYDRGVEMIRAMIDKMLKKYQKVKYVCVRGNHSETLELILAKTIRIAYENEPRVEVLDNTSKHIPLQFEKNFLLFTHGDRLNDQKKADIVVANYREQHGAAKFSHVLSGHLHHAYQKDLSGVLVEIFPVLPSPDAWHCESGYMSADKAASVLTYHKSGGIIGRTITNPRIFLDNGEDT
jgi:UDP-2,3-diacylglucosamine pyrophosphatase LpxH